MEGNAYKVINLGIKILSEDSIEINSFRMRLSTDKPDLTVVPRLETEITPILRRKLAEMKRKFYF